MVDDLTFAQNLLIDFHRQANEASEKLIKELSQSEDQQGVASPPTPQIKAEDEDFLLNMQREALVSL